MIQHLFVCNQNLAEVVKKLEENSELAIDWFQNNYMKLNTDLCLDLSMNIFGLR